MENNELAHNIYEGGTLLQDSNTGDYTIGDVPLPYKNPLTIDTYYDNYWYPFVYPTVTYVPERSKIEQAFQILNKLMKKGVVKVDKVKTFVDLVMEISGCI